LVFEIVLGLFITTVAALPGGKFYPGRLGTTQKLTPIEPAWIGRLFIGGIGLAMMLDGISRIRHH
jgi:hypothetical protein